LVRQVRSVLSAHDRGGAMMMMMMMTRNIVGRVFVLGALAGVCLICSAPRGGPEPETVDSMVQREGVRFLERLEAERARDAASPRELWRQ
jgi:hypothetical protein